MDLLLSFPIEDWATSILPNTHERSVKNISKWAFVGVVAVGVGSGLYALFWKGEKQIQQSLKDMNRQIVHQAPSEEDKSIEINIFDFDGTLFRSPMINSKFWDQHFLGYAIDMRKNGGLGWFQNVKSLSPPYVPLHPSEEWFNEEILKKVRESMDNPHAISVLLTGRTDRFLERIKEITHAAGLNFDELGLKPTAASDLPQGERLTTMKFKQGFIGQVLLNYCEKNMDKAIRINMWDDRTGHINQFKTFFDQKQYLKDHQWLENHQIQFKITHVTEGSTYFDQNKDMQLVKDLIQDIPENQRPKLLVVNCFVHLLKDSTQDVLAWLEKTQGNLPENAIAKATRVTFSPHTVAKIQGLLPQDSQKEVSMTVIALAKTKFAILAKVKVLGIENQAFFGTLTLASFSKVPETEAKNEEKDDQKNEEKDDQKNEEKDDQKNEEKDDQKNEEKDDQKNEEKDDQKSKESQGNDNQKDKTQPSDKNKKSHSTRSTNKKNHNNNSTNNKKHQQQKIEDPIEWADVSDGPQALIGTMAYVWSREPPAPKPSAPTPAKPTKLTLPPLLKGLYPDIPHKEIGGCLETLSKLVKEKKIELTEENRLTVAKIVQTEFAPEPRLNLEQIVKDNFGTELESKLELVPVLIAFLKETVQVHQIPDTTLSIPNLLHFLTEGIKLPLLLEQAEDSQDFSNLLKMRRERVFSSKIDVGRFVREHHPELLSKPEILPQLFRGVFVWMEENGIVNNGWNELVVERKVQGLKIQ